MCVLINLILHCVFVVCRNVFLVCPMKNAPVLVVKQSSNGDYKHVTLPTDGEVGILLLLGSALGIRKGWRGAGNKGKGDS